MLGYGIKETTATTGTGTLTLSAVTGFPRFSNAFADGDLVMYSLLDASGNPLECGIGTYVASNTLARTYPMVTWNGTTYANVNPTALSLSGTTTVICTGVPGSQNVALPAVNNLVASATAQGSAHWFYAANSSTTVTANRMYVHPFKWEGFRPINGLSFRVSGAAAAGKIAKCGMYRVGVDGALGALLEQSGTFAVDTTGVKTYTLGSPKYYPPGWYAMAFASDGAPIINGWSNAFQEALFGVDANNLTIMGVTVDLGAWSNLPNPFSGTPTGLSWDGVIPMIHVL